MESLKPLKKREFMNIYNENNFNFLFLFKNIKIKFYNFYL